MLGRPYPRDPVIEDGICACHARALPRSVDRDRDITLMAGPTPLDNRVTYSARCRCLARESVDARALVLEPVLHKCYQLAVL